MYFKIEMKEFRYTLALEMSSLTFPVSFLCDERDMEKMS